MSDAMFGERTVCEVMHGGRMHPGLTLPGRSEEGCVGSTSMPMLTDT
jgi:hypothetical protein